jgi:threonine dehydratase
MQVLSSHSINELAGRQLLFKAEVFQRSGSFKIRGAANAVFSLPDSVAAAGVITHRFTLAGAWLFERLSGFGTLPCCAADSAEM